MILAADVGMLDWSPDGQLIAYHGSQATGGPTHLRLVAPDGTFDNEVAGTPPGSILPFWSPDSSASPSGPDRTDSPSNPAEVASPRC